MKAFFLRFNYKNDDVCFFVWVYEIEQYKLKVERCFASISNQWGHLICLIQGAAILIEQALAMMVKQCNDQTDKRYKHSIERWHC